MTYTLDFNERVRLGMADPDDEPNADRKRDACPDCGRPRCRGGCPEGRAAMKALRARLADPSTYAEPEF